MLANRTRVSIAKSVTPHPGADRELLRALDVVPPDPVRCLVPPSFLATVACSMLAKAQAPEELLQPIFPAEEAWFCLGMTS